MNGALTDALLAMLLLVVSVSFYAIIGVLQDIRDDIRKRFMGGWK